MALEPQVPISRWFGEAESPTFVPSVPTDGPFTKVHEPEKLSP